MDPTAITILNKSGAAFAADTDGTLYQLSSQEPLAIAVNPHSPIPWGSLIPDHLEHKVFSPKLKLEDYLTDVQDLIKGIDFIGKEKVLLIGYGKEDLLPTLLEVDITSCSAAVSCVKAVTVSDPVVYGRIGDFDRISPIFGGATTVVKDFVRQQFQQSFDTYKQKIKNRILFPWEKDELYKRLDTLSAAERSEAVMDFADISLKNDLDAGIGVFSIEEMVDMAETLISANSRLKGHPSKSKETAVITRSEGLSWLQHSKYTIWSHDSSCRNT